MHCSVKLFVYPTTWLASHLIWIGRMLPVVFILSLLLVEDQVHFSKNSCYFFTKHMNHIFMGIILDLEFLIFGLNIISNLFCTGSSSWLLSFKTVLKFLNICFLGTCGCLATSLVSMLSFFGWTHSSVASSLLSKLSSSLFLSSLLSSEEESGSPTRSSSPTKSLHSFQCLSFHRNLPTVSHSQ